MQEKIVILDFGSQYTQLIARRVRELNVYCEIHPFNKIPELDASVRGVILSGSPFSVRDENAPKPDLTAIKGRLPLLGVCYGAQYLAHFYGGEVQSGSQPGVRTCDAYGRRAVRSADAGSSVAYAGVDVARRYDYLGSRHLPGDRQHGGRALCRLPYRGRAELGYSVPSGGVPFDRRHYAASEFRGRHLRLQAELDAGEFRRNDRPGVA